MKKLITLTLSLLMALSLCLTISADEQTYELSEGTKNALSGQTITYDGNETIPVNNNTDLRFYVNTYEEENNVSAMFDYYKSQLSGDTSNLKYIPVTFEIKLQVKVGEGYKDIESLGEVSSIPVTLKLKDEFINILNNAKDIKMMVGSEGVLSLVSANLSGDHLTFESGNPGDYGFMITYYEKSSNTNNSETNVSTSTKSYNAKDKNHDGMISCEEEMEVANWVWSESKQACVYKVTNTSVK